MTKTVITTMKNEGAFLLEWVAHHKALGFDHIVICTNDCADPTREMALRLGEMGLVRHHATKKWASTSTQRAALKQASRYPEVAKADWLYVCDADEFLVCKIGNGSLQALVDAANTGVDVIAIPWRIFGPNGQSDYREGRITTQFLYARAEPHLGQIAPAYPKSVFRGLQNMHRIGIHGPVPRPGLGRDLHRELPGGQPMIPQHHPIFVQADYSFAQINHYTLRSRDSFLVKRDRGRVNHMLQSMDIDYWDRFDVAQVACSAIRRYDQPTQNWLDQLLSDPALAALHAAAVAWHRAKLTILHQSPDYAALIAATDERLRQCASSQS